MYEDCPHSELEICWWYEYAREGMRGSPVQHSLFPPDGRPELFPEWPDKPYLLIPELERVRRVQRLAGGSTDHLRSLNLKPPFQSHFSPELAKRYLDGFNQYKTAEAKCCDNRLADS
jgi:hypothetical protein